MFSLDCVIILNVLGECKFLNVPNLYVQSPSWHLKVWSWSMREITFCCFGRAWPCEKDYSMSPEWVLIGHYPSFVQCAQVGRGKDLHASPYLSKPSSKRSVWTIASVKCNLHTIENYTFFAFRDFIVLIWWLLPFQGYDIHMYDSSSNVSTYLGNTSDNYFRISNLNLGHNYTFTVQARCLYSDQLCGEPALLLYDQPGIGRSLAFQV